jgi:pyridoxamine 5'-phosphate oxidase
VAEFQHWYRQAREVGEQQPDAMALATVSSEGRPSNRMVLLKGVEAGGFTFFSNYESAKGLDLGSNPHAALVFFWYRLHRQVRVEGRVSRVGRDESEDVPAPPNWGGYRLRPDVVEFWQGREDRLHDRIRYDRTEDGWRKQRLAP